MSDLYFENQLLPSPQSSNDFSSLDSFSDYFLSYITCANAGIDNRNINFCACPDNCSSKSRTLKWKKKLENNSPCTINLGPLTAPRKSKGHVIHLDSISKGRLTDFIKSLCENKRNSKICKISNNSDEECKCCGQLSTRKIRKKSKRKKKKKSVISLHITLSSGKKSRSSKKRKENYNNKSDRGLPICECPSLDAINGTNEKKSAYSKNTAKAIAFQVGNQTILVSMKATSENDVTSEHQTNSYEHKKPQRKNRINDKEMNSKDPNKNETKINKLCKRCDLLQDFKRDLKEDLKKFIDSQLKRSKNSSIKSPTCCECSDDQYQGASATNFNRDNSNKPRRSSSQEKRSKNNHKREKKCCCGNRNETKYSNKNSRGRKRRSASRGKIKKCCTCFQSHKENHKLVCSCSDKEGQGDNPCRCYEDMMNDGEKNTTKDAACSCYRGSEIESEENYDASRSCCMCTSTDEEKCVFLAYEKNDQQDNSTPNTFIDDLMDEEYSSSECNQSSYFKHDDPFSKFQNIGFSKRIETKYISNRQQFLPNENIDKQWKQLEKLKEEVEKFCSKKYNFHSPYSKYHINNRKKLGLPSLHKTMMNEVNKETHLEDQHKVENVCPVLLENLVVKLDQNNFLVTHPNEGLFKINLEPTIIKKRNPRHKMSKCIISKKISRRVIETHIRRNLKTRYNLPYCTISKLLSRK